MAKGQTSTAVHGLVAATRDGSNIVEVDVGVGVPIGAFGQTANTSGGSVANQCVGTVALPAIAAGAEGTVTLTNSLITATSIIFLTVFNQNTDVTAGAQVAVDVRPPVAGSVVIHYKSAVLMSAAWSLWYLIVN